MNKFGTFIEKYTGELAAILLLIVTLIVISQEAKAQNAYELGAVFDPSMTPKFKGAASFLTPVGETLSYSTALINKPVDGVFTYGIVTGLRQKLPIPPIYGVTLWLDLQGGAAASPSASSGAFLGGLVASRPVRGSLTLVTSAKAFVAPVNEDGITLQTFIGFQFK